MRTRSSTATTSVAFGRILGWVGIVLATMALLTVIGVALIFLPV